MMIQDGKIQLSHELNSGWYLIPGGGTEGDESLEDCCIREMREETGYLVRPAECYLTTKEYYGDWCYFSHYFLCEALGQTAAELTELEKERGLIPEWVSIDDACDIFAEHVHLDHYEKKRRSYQREETALKVFREIYKLL